MMTSLDVARPGGARPAVEAADVVVRRGTGRGARIVVGPVSFRIETGAVTGLLGPSGCGKTSLLRAVVGVQARVGGRLRVLGEPAGSPVLRTRIGYVTQAPSVYLDLTVRENLRYFAAIARPERPRPAPARPTPGGTGVDDAINLVGLGRLAETLVGRLSGGEKSRVSLAAALLGRPEVLVMDEPTVGLDPVLRRQLWDTFHRLAAAGTSLVVSSHVMDEAGRCDRLLLMRDGRLLADDTPAALRASTGTDDLEEAFLRLVDSPLAAAAGEVPR